MTFEEYQAFVAQGFTRIPVAKTVLADFDTPLSSYLKLADAPYSYLLESVHGGEKWGRYSIIGLPCRRIFKVMGYDVIESTIDAQGVETVVSTETVADPLATVAAIQKRYQAADLPNLPRFNGGLVGYFGYDTVRYIEPKLADSCPEDDMGLPDILLMLSDELVVFDNLSGKIIFIVHIDPSQDKAWEQAQLRLDSLTSELRQNALPNLSNQVDTPLQESDFVSHYGEAQFLHDVEKMRDYIFSGDIMQAVISQRMSAPFTAPPINLYRALRSLNPSPYMYFLNLGDHHIVGSSPEILARLEENEVTVRPIAGTRHRGKTEQEDLNMEQELLSDPKELAEHLMLIDLGRNDCGRVSQTGSVKVTDQMVVERYSHVMHMVSNVTGQLTPGLDAIDVLRATHPAGTLSGAPKIRAMELLDQFEPVKRGIYGGAIGYLSFSGNMDLAIAIRTAVIANEKVYVQAGAGVVADSVPRLEWKETMNKARALFRAAYLATSDEL
jgi:anthranilate synthase component 1